MLKKKTIKKSKGVKIGRKRKAEVEVSKFFEVEAEESVDESDEE